jgi:hypothetical protein
MVYQSMRSAGASIYEIIDVLGESSIPSFEKSICVLSTRFPFEECKALDKLSHFPKGAYAGALMLVYRQQWSELDGDDAIRALTLLVESTIGDTPSREAIWVLNTWTIPAIRRLGQIEATETAPVIHRALATRAVWGSWRSAVDSHIGEWGSLPFDQCEKAILDLHIAAREALVAMGIPAPSVQA